MRLKRNTIELYDDWLAFWRLKIRTYFTIEEGNYYIKNLYPGSAFTRGRLFSMLFFEDPEN